MTEFRSIRWVAVKLFYCYKMLGVVTIPLITGLFIFSTANLLSVGGVTNASLSVVWAVVYAVCFEMNGLRLIIDASGKKIQHIKGAWIDFALGVFLVSIGVSSTYIEGLVSTTAISWDDLKGSMRFILAVRSIAILGMIVRECVHYAPLVLSVVHENEQRIATRNVRKMEAQNEVIVLDNKRKSDNRTPVDVVQIPKIAMVDTVEARDVAAQTNGAEEDKVKKINDEQAFLSEALPQQIEDAGNSDTLPAPPLTTPDALEEPEATQEPIAIDYGAKILEYLRDNNLEAGNVTPAERRKIADVAKCSEKTVKRKLDNFTQIKKAANFK